MITDVGVKGWKTRGNAQMLCDLWLDCNSSLATSCDRHRTFASCRASQRTPSLSTLRRRWRHRRGATLRRLLRPPPAAYGHWRAFCLLPGPHGACRWSNRARRLAPPIVSVAKPSLRRAQSGELNQVGKWELGTLDRCAETTSTSPECKYLCQCKTVSSTCQIHVEQHC